LSDTEGVCARKSHLRVVVVRQSLARRRFFGERARHETRPPTWRAHSSRRWSGSSSAVFAGATSVMRWTRDHRATQPDAGTRLPPCSLAFQNDERNRITPAVRLKGHSA